MDYTKPFVRVSVSWNTGGMDFSSLARAVAPRWYRLHHGNGSDGMGKQGTMGLGVWRGLMSLNYWLSVSYKGLTQLECDKSNPAIIEIDWFRCRNLYLSEFVYGQSFWLCVRSIFDRDCDKKNAWNSSFTQSLECPYTLDSSVTIHWFMYFTNSSFTQPIAKLTHCGLMTPYGGMDLGQHWLR